MNKRLTRLQRQQLRLIGNVAYYNSFKTLILDVDYYPSDPYILNAKVKLTLWEGREVIRLIPILDLVLVA